MNVNVTTVAILMLVMMLDQVKIARQLANETMTAEVKTAKVKWDAEAE